MASKEQASLLPPALIANILSYNLRDLVDVARLRELNKGLGRLAVSLIPSLVPASGHFLPTSGGNNGFVHELISPPQDLGGLGEGGEEEDYNEDAEEEFFANLWKDYQDLPNPEGVAIVDGILSTELGTLLNNSIQYLAQKQEQEGTVDYHPNSNNVVRDLVHPALYSYVSGVSPRSGVSPLEPCNLPVAVVDNESVAKQDFWRRKYEDSVYQWMPTTFSIDKHGSCAIEDYINNLTPREAHGDLYDSLAKLFEQCLPFIESVYSYVCSIQPHLRTDYFDIFDANIGPLTDTRDQRFISLRGQKLQVITKIVDYELQPEQSHEGVWHVEGMSHEEIVLTCLYILDRDDSVDGGYLQFKRAFFDVEARHIVTHVPQASSSPQHEMVRNDLKPLGTVPTPKGRLIVFPNSHIHRVTEMLNEGTAMARRRIVVFFLVNPLRRIVSTREVPPQQITAAATDETSAKKRQRGSMTLDEAKKHRLELMKERKYTKQDWNVREIELCEH